jgi:superfamily II DNA/RNA helicase/cold shock CspA family protein
MPPTPASRPATFADLGLPSRLTAALERAGIHAPFPIQAAVIPDVLAGRDVAGRAPTGSGKTLGFGLPIVAGLTGAARRRPTALVLAPTRELAEQIMTELVPFTTALGHRAVAIYGGVGYGRQRSALDRGVELVVACPGRLEDLIQMGAVDLSEVTSVVIDEADQMADMGFLPAVRRIVDRTVPDRQVLLFSATLDGPVASLVREYQQDPARHEVGRTGPDLSSARHVFWQAERTDRVAITADVASQVGSTIVFTRTRHGADRVARQLGKRGVDARPIHGGRSQGQRDRALEAFKNGTATALVATDVAARGIHVDGVSCVVHFDPPGDAATYHHRSGRTARAGATGVVVSLVDATTAGDVRALQKGLGLDVPIGRPDVAGLVAAPVAGSTPAAEPLAGSTPAAAPVAGSVPVADSGTSRAQGTVKFFNPSRGYGFIRHDEGDEVFVHHSNIVADPATFRTLERDARVAFDVRPGRRGPEAVAVVALA